eukprot:g31021.t2
MLYDERAVLGFREVPGLQPALTTLRAVKDSGLSEYVDENLRMLATEVEKVCFSESGGSQGHASRLRNFGSAVRNNLEAAGFARSPILTPFGRTMQKQLKTRSWLLQQDGTFKALDIPGPPSFDAWKACWKVFRAILFMLRYPPAVAGADHLRVITSACLEEYYDRISKLNQDFPETWHLIMKAEDKCRSEMFERYRRHLTKAAADNRLPMGLDFQPNQPWIGVFTYAARNREFWDEHVIGPATMFIARGGRNMTMDKAEKFEREDSTRKYRFLELFAGKAGLSREIERLCGNLVEVQQPLDVMEDWDILTDEGFVKAKGAVLSADHTHMAFPCRSFSRARRQDGHGSVPVIRSDSRPEGWGHPTAEEGNRILERVIALIYLVEEAGKTWSLENPSTSYAWEQPKMVKILKIAGVRNVDLDQCPYGAHTRKSTKIVTSAAWMAEVKLKCEDVRPHFHLPGGLSGKTWNPVTGEWVWKTSRAAEYPFGLCNAWAQALLTWLESPGGYEWLASRTMVHTKSNQLVLMKNKLEMMKRKRAELAAQKECTKEAKKEMNSPQASKEVNNKSKIELREEENLAAVGGLRDPRKAVARNRALRKMGHRVREALALCIGEHDLSLFEKDMKVSPELIQKAVQMLHEEFEVNETQNAEGYKVALFQAMLDAAGDADAQVLPRWLNDGVPLGLSAPIEHTNVFPATDEVVDAPLIGQQRDPMLVVEKAAMIEAFKHDARRLSLALPEANALATNEVSGHTFRRSGVKDLARKNTPLPLIQFFARHSSSAVLAYVEEAYEESPDGNLQVLNHLEMRDQIAALSAKTNDMAMAYDQLKTEYEELAEKCNMPLDRAAILKMFTQWSHPEIVVNLVTGKLHSTMGNCFRNHPNEWVTACGWPWIAAGRVAKAIMEPADLPQNMQTTACERCKEKLPNWARPDIDGLAGVSPWMTLVHIDNQTNQPVIVHLARNAETPNLAGLQQTGRPGGSERTGQDAVEHTIPANDVYGLASGWLREPRATLLIRTEVHKAQLLRASNNARIMIRLAPHGLHVESPDDVEIEAFEPAQDVSGHDTVPMALRGESFHVSTPVEPDLRAAASAEPSAPSVAQMAVEPQEAAAI